MSDMEKFALLLEQRDKVQAEAQQRLVQVHMDSTQSLSDVASSLSKVHGAQQDAHDVLGAVEKAIVDHDNSLRRHVDAIKQRNKEQDKEQERLASSVTTGYTEVQTLQKDTETSIVKALGEVKTALDTQTTATNKLIEKQVSIGKSLGAIITVSGGVAVLIGALLAIMKLFSVI